MGDLLRHVASERAADDLPIPKPLDHPVERTVGVVHLADPARPEPVDVAKAVPLHHAGRSGDGPHRAADAAADEDRQRDRDEEHDTPGRRGFEHVPYRVVALLDVDVDPDRPVAVAGHPALEHEMPDVVEDHPAHIEPRPEADEPAPFAGRTGSEGREHRIAHLPGGRERSGLARGERRPVDKLRMGEEVAVPVEHERDRAGGSVRGQISRQLLGQHDLAEHADETPLLVKRRIV